MPPPSVSTERPDAAIVASAPRSAGRHTASSLRRFLLRGMVANATFSAASALLGLATTTLLAHELGARGLGLYAWPLAWVMALRVPAVAGTDRLVTREIAGERKTTGGTPAEVLRWAEASIVRISIPVAAAVAAAALLLGHSAHQLGAYLALAMPMVPLLAVLAVRQAALLADRRVVWGQLPDSVLRPACFLALVAAAALAGSDVLTPATALLAQLGATVAALVAVSRIARRAFGRIACAASKPRPAGWLRSGFRIAANNTIGVLATQLDLLLLGVLRGPRDAGIYALVTRGAYLVYVPVLCAQPALGPAIVSLHASGERRLRPWVTRITRYVFLATLAGSIALGAVGGIVLHLVAPGFESGLTTLRLLLVSVVISAFVAFGGLILTLTGHERSAVRSAAAGAIGGAVVAVALIPTLGIVGAAVGAIARAGLRNGWNAVVAWRKLQLDPTILGVRPPGELPVPADPG